MKQVTSTARGWRAALALGCCVAATGCYRGHPELEADDGQDTNGGDDGAVDMFCEEEVLPAATSRFERSVVRE